MSGLFFTKPRVVFSCQSEMLHNLPPLHLSCCLPSTPTTLPPFRHLLPSSSTLTRLDSSSHVHSLLFFGLLLLLRFPPLPPPPSPLCRHRHTHPFVVLPPCLVVWWPGTGTVQGILSDTTMREHFGTCCSSSNLGSPRNSTTSRCVPVRRASHKLAAFCQGNLARPLTCLC